MVSGNIIYNIGLICKCVINILACASLNFSLDFDEVAEVQAWFEPGHYMLKKLHVLLQDEFNVLPFPLDYTFNEVCKCTLIFTFTQKKLKNNTPLYFKAQGISGKDTKYRMRWI